ncbi:MAG: hypothetical protein CR986_02950 [Ignavibacteriae bacterium]|nr:MAG: hypothetical protein CR986_02950 [Ignavibacteriota bacterium]
MIAVIKGDIIASRKLKDTKKWLSHLKRLFNQWGKMPKQWDFVWGDLFQLEISNPIEALEKAFIIKSYIKKLKLKDKNSKYVTLDVRMAIGIGAKEYSDKRISQSNGEAFINSGDIFDNLKKEKTNLLIKSPWELFDKEINLYLKLAGTFMDKWTIPSAELVEFTLQNPGITQAEIGKKFGIKQNSVSGRWTRANMDEIIEINNVFKAKLSRLI